MQEIINDHIKEQKEKAQIIIYTWAPAGGCTCTTPVMKENTQKKIKN